MSTICSQAEFQKILASGIPDAATFTKLTTIVLDHPEARKLSKMDPFTPAYKQAALDLYLSLRGNGKTDYIAERDETSASPQIKDVWTASTPFSFRQTGLVAEHLLSWAHILHLLDLSGAASVIEYGPGSGQLLLILARMGFQAFAVDIDPAVGRLISHQASAMGLDVSVEQAQFGEGFNQRRFDRIIFFEAFHHAFDFEALLVRLHDRLAPGGRIVLCGEPIVRSPIPSVPFPWGPRLDALSVYCMQKYGWMELGFTHEFFMELARRTGWKAEFHEVSSVGRASAYTLLRASEAKEQERMADGFSCVGSAFVSEHLRNEEKPPGDDQTKILIENLKSELEAVYGSTSWRLTAPLRFSKRLFRR